MSWTSIEGEELAHLKRRIDAAAAEKTNWLEAARLPLPFYRNGSLLRVRSAFGGEIACASIIETGDGALLPLDGSVDQILAANEMAALNLDIGNVITYARFFCLFLTLGNGESSLFVTEHGPWSLDTGRTPEDLEPRVRMMDDASRGYLIDAYIAYDQTMFAVQFGIGHDGTVEMIEEEPLGRFVLIQYV